MASIDAEEVFAESLVQELWSGQGRLLRMRTTAAQQPSVVLKIISPQFRSNHPRGWNTNASYQRKLASYRVEANWYRQYAHLFITARVPVLLGLKVGESQTLILLEDLSAQFPLTGTDASYHQTQLCLEWLAEFHARFLGNDGRDLWEQGCYWHLDTRGDEFAAMVDGPVKRHAKALDHQLRKARFQTLVHGDAKVANFCFATDLSCVAAVDFQYVGRGCGIRDVAYLLGSCLTESECVDHADGLLDDYFSYLRTALGNKLSANDLMALELEWRSLYAVAWTDFYRFLLGWMPTHSKINAYTRKLAEKVCSQ